MDTSVSLLASFLPGPLVRILSDRSTLPERLTWETCRAATMQMDVSGFSPLTQRLAADGALGTEEIVALLDRYFDALIDTVDRHGGLMVGFGGDSLVATWFVDETTSESAAAQHAAVCALEAQHTIAQLSSGEGEGLGFRIGIGFGDAVLLDLGGLEGRWIFAMSGPALSDMGTAVVETDPGGVAVSGAFAALVAEKARFGPMRNGNFELLEFDPANQEAERQFARPTLAAEVAPVVEAYLPAGLLDRLRIGEPRWMAEHRTTTNLFLNLPGLDVTEDRGRNALQLVVRTAQEAFDRYEGVLAAVVADDKGTTILGMFGLPPVSGEEDSIRAIATGQTLSRALLDLHIDHGVGIATGRSYCGIYGNDVFRTYAVVGPGVNLAARLMQAANNEVLCDQATVRATRGRVHFSALPPVRVKGITDPIPVQRPIWAEQALRSGSLRGKGSRPILGRAGEQALIADRLRSAAASRTSARIVLQGEAGIGKTVLALDAVGTATSLGFRCLVGGADPVETAPYHAWRAIGRQALGFDSIVDATDQRARLEDSLQRTAGLAGFAPLLNVVLGTDIPENDTTRAMSRDARREQTGALMVHLLGEVAATGPLLIAMEDCHWLDDASWDLLEQVTDELEPLTLLLTNRPFVRRPPHSFYERLVEDLEATVVRLERIDATAARLLAADRLDAETLPDAVAELIETKAEGHPLFIEELVYSLRDQGYLQVEGGAGVLAVAPDLLDQLDLPDSIQGLTAGRLGRLSPIEQSTVKVASVLTGGFDAELLTEIHPLHLDRDVIARQLEDFVRLDLVRGDTGGYRFRHTIMKDSAYQQLPVTVRRELHEAVADLSEKRGVDRSGFAVLAHHWEEAGKHRPAVEYWEAAGAAASAAGAVGDAAGFYQRALTLSTASGSDGEAVVSQETRSHWQMAMAEAYTALGRLDEAVEQYGAALAGLHRPIPSGRAATVFTILREAFVQLGHLIRNRIPKEAEPGPTRQAASIYSALGEVFYFQAVIPRWVAVNLRAINLAERSGDPAMAGVAYAGLGNLVGTFRLHRLARRYFRLARAAPRLPVHFGQVGPLAATIESDFPVVLGSTTDLAEAVYLLTGSTDRSATVNQLLQAATEWMRRFVGHEVSRAALAVRGFASTIYGPLDAARADLTQLAEDGRRRHQAQHETWGLTLLIPVMLESGDVSGAMRSSDAAAEVVERADPISRPLHLSTRAWALAAAGQGDDAMQCLRDALESIRPSPIFLYLTAYTSLCETLLLLDRGVDTRSLWGKILGEMRRYGRLLPFARARYHLYKGAVLGQRDKRAAATRQLTRGLDRASRAGLVWDQARLHKELAALSPAGSAEQRRHADAAAEARRRLG